MHTLASLIIISLDGFYEGPNGELDRPIVDQEFNDCATRQLDEAGMIAFRRSTLSTWRPTGLPIRPRRTIRP
jgi:hypothetical protein